MSTGNTQILQRFNTMLTIVCYDMVIDFQDYCGKIIVLFENCIPWNPDGQTIDLNEYNTNKP